MQNQKSKIKNDTGAIRDYTYYISKTSNSSNLYSAFSNRGLLKEGFGDIKGAFDDYASALKLNNKDPFAHWNKANLLFSQKNYRQSLKDFRAAAELDPRNADQLINFANCYQAISLTDSACILWRRAGELGSKVAYDNMNKFCK